MDMACDNVAGFPASYSNKSFELIISQGGHELGLEVLVAKIAVVTESLIHLLALTGLGFAPEPSHPSPTKNVTVFNESIVTLVTRCEIRCIHAAFEAVTNLNS